MASVVVDCPGDCLVGSNNDSLKELDSLFISLRKTFEQNGHTMILGPLHARWVDCVKTGQTDCFLRYACRTVFEVTEF